MTATLEENLTAVNARIRAAAMTSGRDPQEIKLLAVTKSVGADRIRRAFELGQARFGENYLQEAMKKMPLLADLSIEWHFIGRIQSNKTRTIAEYFAWAHAIDRLDIAQRLSSQRPDSLPPLNVCLQYNVSGESSKGGAEVSDIKMLAEAVSDLPRLKLRGLMALPAPADTFEMQRAAFHKVWQSYQTLRSAGFALDTLSIGTSSDLEAAIAENATLVRVGSAIFGPRPLKQPLV